MRCNTAPTQLLRAKKVGDSAKEGVACRKLGAALQQLGTNKEAKEYLESSVAIARQSIAMDELRIIYEDLGRSYKASGEEEKSAEILTRGVAAKDQLGVCMQVRRCGNLGQSLLKLEMTDRSTPEHGLHLC